MKNRVITILKCFSESEIKHFKSYLNCSYFNKSKKLRILLFELLKFHPHYSAPKLSYEYLHNKISPKLNYNSVTIRRLLNDLEKLSLNFLAQKRFENNSNLYNESLRNELLAKSLNTHYKNSIEEIEKSFGQNESIYEDYFLQKLKVEDEKFSFLYVTQKLANQKVIDTEINSLTRSIRYLCLYFIMKIVRLFLNIKSFHYNSKELSEIDQICSFFDTFLSSFNNTTMKNFLRENFVDYYFIIEIYHNLFKCFIESDNNKYYFKVKKLLLNYSTFFSKREKYFLFGMLINSCSIKIIKNIDKEIFHKELISLYGIILSKKYYMLEKNSYLPFSLYRNILKLAIDLKKFKWAEDFILNYSEKLHPSIKQNLKNYSYALLYFQKKNMIESLNYINKIDFDIFKLKSDIRGLSIMIQYELKNFEGVISMILSYRSFFKKNNLINKDTKIKYLNFLSYIDKFVKFINNRNKTYILYTRDKLIETKDIVNKDWLVEKANELAKDYIKVA